MYLFTDRPWKTWKNEKDTRHDEGKITTINKDPISIYIYGLIKLWEGWNKYDIWKAYRRRTSDAKFTKYN